MKLGFLWLCTELGENCGKAFRGRPGAHQGETKVPCDMNTATRVGTRPRWKNSISERNARRIHDKLSLLILTDCDLFDLRSRCLQTGQGAEHDANSERQPA